VKSLIHIFSREFDQNVTVWKSGVLRQYAAENNLITVERTEPKTGLALYSFQASQTKYIQVVTILSAIPNRIQVRIFENV